MGVIQLTEREQLIERILKMPEDKVAAITEFLQELEDVEKAEDAEDLATLEARKNEIGIPLDDALSELGYTREELMQKARDEGLVK